MEDSYHKPAFLAPSREEPDVQDGLALLPETVVRRHLLPHLEARDLARLGCVSKRWRDLSNDPVLWRSLYVRDFYGCWSAVELRELSTRLASAPPPPRPSLQLRAPPLEEELVSELIMEVRVKDFESAAKTASHLAHQKEKRFKLSEVVEYVHGILEPADEDEEAGSSRFNVKPRSAFERMLVRRREDLGRRENIAMQPARGLLRDFSHATLTPKAEYAVRALEAAQRARRRGGLVDLHAHDRKMDALHDRIGDFIELLASIYSQGLVFCACFTAFLALVSEYLRPESTLPAAHLMIPWWIALAYLFLSFVLEFLLLVYDKDTTSLMGKLLHDQDFYGGFYEQYMSDNRGEGGTSLARIQSVVIYLLGLGGLAAFTVILPMKMEGSLQETSWAVVFIPLYVFCFASLLAMFLPKPFGNWKNHLYFASFLAIVRVLPITVQIVLVNLRCLDYLTSNFAIVLIPFFVAQVVAYLGYISYSLDKYYVDDLCERQVCLRVLRHLLPVPLTAPFVATEALLVMYISDRTRGSPERFALSTVFAPAMAWFGAATLRLAYYCATRFPSAEAVEKRMMSPEPGADAVVPRPRRNSHRVPDWSRVMYRW